MNTNVTYVVTSRLTLADDTAVRGSRAAGWPSPALPLAPLLYRSPPSLFPVPPASPSLKQETIWNLQVH